MAAFRPDRQYVLRKAVRGNFIYYTGKHPATKLEDAQFFTKKAAGEVMRFATTGYLYRVHRVPDKEFFCMVLKQAY